MFISNTCFSLLVPDIAQEQAAEILMKAGKVIGPKNKIDGIIYIAITQVKISKLASKEARREDEALTIMTQM